MSDLAIHTMGLTRRFGDRTVVEGLDLQVRRGEILGLLGPNGSGKTTIINMLCGLLVPTGGRALVLGLDPARAPAAVRRRIGVVTQETLLYDELTARENLLFYGDLFAIPPRIMRRRIDDLLELVDLAPRQHHRVGTFSGGMKRRLALVRALLSDPELIYLDEPTLGVDVQVRSAIWDRIRALPAAGKTVLLTTNYMEEAEALAGRLAVIDRGRLVALGTPTELTAGAGAAVIEAEVIGLDSGLLAELQELDGVEHAAATGGRLVLRVRDWERLLPRLMAVLAGRAWIEDLSLRRPGLNDAFLQLTGRSLRD